VGLALLPCLWAVAREVILMGPALWAEGVRSWWAYAAGAAAYGLVEMIFSKPMWVYVVGHELTHALSGILSGAKVYSFRAASKGGEVRLSKTNPFIALSPYIVPLYSLLVIAAFCGVRQWWPSPKLAVWFQFALGATLAFHFSLTVNAFHRRQTDLKVLGMFLSAVLVLLGNFLILAILGISLFNRTPALSRFSGDIAKNTVVAWKKGFDFAWERVKGLENLWIH
jgi:hypothetical protein